MADPAYTTLFRSPLTIGATIPAKIAPTPTLFNAVASSLIRLLLWIIESPPATAVPRRSARPPSVAKGHQVCLIEGTAPTIQTSGRSHFSQLHGRPCLHYALPISIDHRRHDPCQDRSYAHIVQRGRQ